MTEAGAGIEIKNSRLMRIFCSESKQFYALIGVFFINAEMKICEFVISR